MTEPIPVEWNQLVVHWKQASACVYQIAESKGWWEGDIDIHNQAEKLALMHSELSEALEAIRHHNPESKKIAPFGNLEEELADAVIRIMDFGHAYGLDVGSAIVEKCAYNANREFKHGGKAF